MEISVKEFVELKQKVLELADKGHAEQINSLFDSFLLREDSPKQTSFDDLFNTITTSFKRK